MPVAILILVILFSANLAATAGEVRGKAEVRDGDSVVVEGREIRLHGIDAPEFRQTCLLNGEAWRCGRSAKRALSEMLGAAPIRCTWTERDAYARVLATCYRDGVNINAQLVRQGLALAYSKYSERYVVEQELAQATHRGLWRSEFVAPWLWRRANAQRNNP